MSKVPNNPLSQYQNAFILSIFTIGYNLVEGSISIVFGVSDKALSLFGFGVDSFVEIISGIGIAHLVLRLKKHNVETKDRFESTALKITGFAFYLLTTGLVAGAIFSMVHQTKPETTTMGIVISGISIITMYFLYRKKLSLGKRLKSEPIISDANCTKTCFYLSFILLASSFLYEIFELPFIDALGSLGIAWYAFKEGKESFEKSKEKSLSCSNSCC